MVFLAVLLAFFFSSGAAQDWCMLNNPVNDKCGVCTAKDVRISSIQRVGGATSCVIGQSLTIDVAVQWESTANGRYDVAAYLAKDGGNALTGACNEFILDPVTKIVGNAVPGTQAAPSTGPFLDTNNDQCGDLDASTVVWQKITQVTITCRDQNRDGIADVSGCTSWNQNQNDNSCVGKSTAVCGSPSKCRCDAVLNIAGLGTCLSSQAPCAGTTATCATQWASRVRVTTTAATTSTVFPPAAITTGYLYYNFEASPAQTFAFSFFPPGTAVTASPTTTRTDLLSPCQVQRQVTCGTTTSCVSIAETMLIPRFFVETTDTLCTGLVCPGTSRAPAQCAQGFKKSGTPTGQAIAYVWTLADKTTPCAAMAADGTFYEFFKDTTPNAGVILGPANVQPANTTAFNFLPSTTCTFPQCAVDVELLFVIDEQVALSNFGFRNVLAYVEQLIGTFNTASTRTRFGVWFTGSSNATSPPLVLTQNIAEPNLVSNVIRPHLQANTSSTNFMTSVTSAINKFWPPSAARTGVAREILTIVGGADSSNGDYSSVQTLLTQNAIQAWSIGVESGATRPLVMAGVSTQGGTYQHYEGIWDTTSLPLNKAYEGQILCPQSNLCGTGCRGFCSCSAPGVNTCVCPTCAAANCEVSSCSNIAVGCVSQPKSCDDRNVCTTDSCTAATGVCANTAIPTNATCGVCLPTSGCQPAPVPTGCTTAANCPVANKCFSFVCTSLTCVPQALAIATCDDSNACTTDTCDPVIGCVHTNITCASTSTCFPTTCVPGAGVQPNCVTGTTSLACADADSCTNDLCVEGVGCTNVNISCPGSTVPCSFPSGCIGTAATPDCIIGNFSCGFSAAEIAGISAGVIAGVVVAAVIAALLIAFLSKKGYDAYMAKSGFAQSGAHSNPAFSANKNVGAMPETAYAAF